MTTMDDIAFLVKEESAGTDENGNEIIERTERRVFCKVRSAARNEFYDAATDNLRPEFILTISHAVDYEGEKLAAFRGYYYDITRTYYDGDAVELTLSGKIGITANNAGEESES